MFRFIRKKYYNFAGNVMVESLAHSKVNLGLIFVMKFGGKIDEEGKSFRKLRVDTFRVVIV